MFEIKGRYNTAKVFTDVVEPAAVAQITQLCNQKFAQGSRIRIMPDVHAGAGCTVGTTMTLTDVAVPSLVGVDIGCGMEVARLRERAIDLPELDRLIHGGIPAGAAVRAAPHRLADRLDWDALRCRKAVDVDRGRLSIGTLGGGNHFIEVDRAEDGTLYLVIHSGSRRMGLEVAKYYQRQAYHQCNGSDEAAVAALTAALRAQGREREIDKAVKKLKNTKRTPLPRELCYVQGRLLDDYLHDMEIMQQAASLNRQAMMAVLVEGLGLQVEERFATVHNYIDLEAGVLRKGAVSAQAGEKLLIPINMRDGALLCVGKGNEDWNVSAPHGAGRLMGRSAARAAFTLEEYRAQMAGVYTTCVNAATLDESPMAYKPMADIVSQIGPTVDMVGILRPLYNFKAGEAPAAQTQPSDE